MASCVACDSELDVDEYEVDPGDIVSCPECGANLVVASTSPLELELESDEDDEDEDEDDFDDDDFDDDDEDDDADDDWDE
ncbi:MAG TPA: hypothetical protein VF198_12750 [Vicinamibacterales bacterium]